MIEHNVKITFYAILILLVSLGLAFAQYYYFQPKKERECIQYLPKLSSDMQLHNLVIRHDLIAAGRHVKKHIDINQKDIQRMTPYLYAAFTGQIEMMELLENSGANIHVRRYGQNALHLAILNNQKEAVEYLISKGLNCLEKDYIEVRYEGGFVKELDKNGDVEQGNNIYHLLSVTGNREMAHLLFKYKDRMDERNEVGQTPLMLAAREGQVQYIDYLLSYGVKMNAVDNVGMTPLHHAVSGHAVEAVRLLLEKGAEVNIPNAMGETVWDTARRINCKELMDILEKLKKTRSPNDFRDKEKEIKMVSI